MERTKEEYIALGDRISSPAVIAQTIYSMTLAKRDAVGLASYGWAAAKTEAVAALLQSLEAANKAYAERFGVHKANGSSLASATRDAKKWRLRALAIGHEALSGEALGELERVTGPTTGRADRFAQQIQQLAALASANEAAFRAEGADDAFFAEGHALAASLAAGSATMASRRKDLPAAHDALDELDGRLFVHLKALNRSGRAFNLAAGDRIRASEYNLDLLYNR